MHNIIESLLNQVESQDESMSQEAVLQLAMLLEISNRPVRIASGAVDLAHYRDILPIELQSLRLEITDQSEIVDRLSELAGNGPASSGMYWAMGKASPQVGVTALLNNLRNHIERLDEESMYQALIALGNFFFTQDEHLLAIVKHKIRNDDPSNLLHMVSQSRNVRLASQARHLLIELRRLELILPE